VRQKKLPAEIILNKFKVLLAEAKHDGVAGEIGIPETSLESILPWIYGLSKNGVSSQPSDLNLFISRQCSLWRMTYKKRSVNAARQND
jgi:hypothetical protein